MFFIFFISTIISLSSPLSFTAKQVLLLFSLFSLYSLFILSPLFFPYFPLHSPFISFMYNLKILRYFFLLLYNSNTFIEKKYLVR